jgi:hypothetical protein
VAKTVTAEVLPGPARQAANPRGVWIERLEKAKVKDRPGIWFRILDAENADKAANHARNINHRRVVLPDGQWEAAARTEDDVSYVWVRYVGP